ncbi:hypothetical protein F5144DRAFT_400635 [Chaetomium tenue]|uniref:Uncharacterized protein n=1 Tax=Chaetomium tenue TaxID=1854479 RepID=A0ACB7NVL8_9PEZI|nr:hypothetical protein F5144DRAFT_400635 [Chaetomium globosum]
MVETRPSCCTSTYRVLQVARSLPARRDIISVTDEALCNNASRLISRHSKCRRRRKQRHNYAVERSWRPCSQRRDTPLVDMAYLCLLTAVSWRNSVSLARGYTACCVRFTTLGSRARLPTQALSRKGPSPWRANGRPMCAGFHVVRRRPGP